jgi:glycosyltransferase involved in cell wall biosynthesis
LKVFIIGNLFTYPDYGAAAASNRVFAYSRGFLQNQVNTTIITLSNVYGYKNPFLENDINCYVALQQQKRNKYFLIRRYYRIKKYINVLLFIKNDIKKSGPISAIILYTRSPFLMIYGKVLALLFSTKIILEVTEHPLNDFKKHSIWKIFFPWAIYPFFDGFTCISKSLQLYCDRYKHKRASIINIPPLIDLDSCNYKSSVKLNEDYLFYSGSLTIYRDGIDNLVKSFNIVNHKYENLKLVLGGIWYDEQTKNEIYNLVNALKLNGKVIFLNFLPKEDITAYSKNAKILCIARNKNNQTSASFPTKLAEYLSTGRPVIVTDVGDIYDYLIDGVNAYLVEAGNIELFAKKIEYVYENYECALKVAEEGKKIAASCFSNKENVKRLINFIQKMN